MMRVIEVRLPEGPARQRGAAYGRTVSNELRNSARLYAGAFRDLGVGDADVDRVVAASAETIPEYAPELWQELQGLVEGSGASMRDLLLLNARTEILAYSDAPQTECSTVVALGPGRAPSTMQTWDWQAELAPTGTMLEIPLGHRVVRTFTETGMLGKIGVTHGLGVHFNILNHASDRGDAGVPVHVLMRMILDRAETVDEAIEIARATPVSASTVLTVVQPQSNLGDAHAVSIELSPAGVAVVGPDDGLLAHTNHFLDPALAEGEARAEEGSTTKPRYRHTVDQRDALLAVRDPYAMAEAFCGSAGDDAPVCMRPKPGAPRYERWESLITIALDVEAAAMDWAVGPPSGFTPDRVARFE
ncbi:MAG TPA: C45 family peptidase [Candidatus Agrococcus pullicola]|uniref:C45 family peptidase n=1 Tax=Candidatus Agrococcus pullicola TaxID=2838429 RepID=A0A9D1YV37_9MICO|nr:C45 family peptidase [Candidatus Agrococcus pullicola]